MPGFLSVRTFPSRTLVRVIAACVLLPTALAAYVLPSGMHSFRTYGSASGLGNGAAMRIAQDRDGFLWVATQDGIYRFDGNRFKPFGLAEGLPSTFVSTIATAPDGAVWAGTYAGVAYYDRERFYAIPATSGLPAQIPNAITIDAEGRLYVALPSGFFRGGRDQHFTPVEGWPAGLEATAVWFDAHARRLYVASSGRVGWLTERGWQFSTAGLAPERIDAVVVDREGRIWARSAKRLWSQGSNETTFRDETATLPAGSSSGYLALDRLRNLWVPTDRGLAIHDEHGWRRIGIAEGLPTEWARDVIEDREGSIWIASLGVHRMLGRGEFTSYDHRSGLPNDVIWSFHIDRDGHLLVGTDLGLARATDSGWTVVPGTDKNQIRALLEEPGGVLWMGGTPSELLRYDPSSRALRHYPIDARTILSLARERDGTLWVATRSGGLLRKRRDSEQFERVAVADGRPTETFREVMVDSADRVWATGELGMSCLDHGVWRRFTKKDGLAVDHIAYLMESAPGKFWAAYFEPLGAVRFILGDDARSIQITHRLDAKHGLSAGKVFLLGNDRGGRLWVGTGVGVDVFGPVFAEHFSMADGLAGDDTDAMAFLAAPDGSVFIGTSAGFSHYVPRPDAAPISAPSVHVVSAAIGGLALPLDGTASFEASNKHRDLSASFAALTYFKEDLVEYQVRLKGWEEDWRTVTTRQVEYERLPPGDYLFEVRARLRPGNWSAPASVAFSIRPAWWQTWWAKVAGALLLIALVALAFRGRVALLRRRNLELQALVDQRTRELGEANEMLMNLSVTDALTGMKNRRYLKLCMPEYASESLRTHERCERAGLDATRMNGDLVFLLIDLDWFKQVNDLYGHHAGDEVLVETHTLIRETMRDSDTIIRWGGEEFLYVARNSSRHEALAVAERLRIAVASHTFQIRDDSRADPDGTLLHAAGAKSIQLTCTVGFAAFPFLPDDRTRLTWEEVIDVADSCLYVAKRAGRNRSLGVIAEHVTDPERLMTRVRRSLPEVAAGGEIRIISTPDPTPESHEASA